MKFKNSLNINRPKIFLLHSLKWVENTTLIKMEIQLHIVRVVHGKMKLKYQPNTFLDMRTYIMMALGLCLLKLRVSLTLVTALVFFCPVIRLISYILWHDMEV